MLKYDTLYQSLKKVSGEWHAGHVSWGFHWYYLKFYADGIVVGAVVASEDTPAILRNLSRDAENVDVGRYQVSENEIQITFSNEKLKGSLTPNGSLIMMRGNLSWDLFSQPNQSPI
jgi:hypothetical protein